MTVKAFWSNYHQRQLRLGRNRPTGLLPRLHLRSYLKAAPQPKMNVDFSAAPGAALPLSQMYLNDAEGDCVVAGLWKARGVIEANVGRKVVIATPAQINADYGRMGGYNGTPQSDNGCDEATALNVLMNYGYADQQKIVAAVSINPANPNEYCWALETFGNLIFGLELPDSYLDPKLAPGFVWDVGTPDPSNGHCIVGFSDNDARGIGIATWGMTGLMTHAAIQQGMAARYGGEMHVFLTREIINQASQEAPDLVDWNTLVADINSIGGNVPVDPTPPTPGPIPIPPAPPGPTPPTPIDWSVLIQMVLSLLKQFGPQAEPILIALLTSFNLPAWLVTLLENLIHLYLGKSLAIHWKIQEE